MIEVAYFTPEVIAWFAAGALLLAGVAQYCHRPVFPHVVRSMLPGDLEYMERARGVPWVGAAVAIALAAIAFLR
ncbi:MAG: hypothetical protein JNG88_10430 [Phycisphaerales bacterium]|nr:hypothetical protein [Phycisphaerales bacterium]